MDKDLLTKGDLKLKIEAGKLVLVLDSAGVDVSVVVETDYFMDKLAAAIPGTIDDAVIGMIKAALKA